MLDIVEAPLRSHKHESSQPENWLINPKKRWIRVDRLSLSDLLKFVETPRNLWLELNTPTDRVSAEYLDRHPPTQSLYLLRLLDAHVRSTEKGKPGFRLHFAYNGIPYRLKITDPIAIASFTERMIGRTEIRLKNTIVCVSLSLPFEGFHYKLIASIVEPASNQKLFTVGHSSRSIDDFIGLLKQNDIEAIADVRSRPYSKRLPHFSREALRSSLLEVGIRYSFLGQELGARRREPNVYVGGQAKYERIIMCDAFQSGITRLVNGTKRYRIALMCAEKDPLMCHRTLLVSRYLQRFGFDIVHILGANLSETHLAAERRLIIEEGINTNQLELAGTGFGNVSPLDRAYVARENRVGFRLGGRQDEDFDDRVYTEIR